MTNSLIPPYISIVLILTYLNTDWMWDNMPNKLISFTHNRRVFSMTITTIRSKCSQITFNSFNSYFDGLVQERRNSMDNALELRLYCNNPSISYFAIYSYFHPAIWWSDIKDQYVSNKQRRLQCRIIGNLPIKLFLNLGVIDYHRPILFHSQAILYHSASKMIWLYQNTQHIVETLGDIAIHTTSTFTELVVLQLISQRTHVDGLIQNCKIASALARGIPRISLHYRCEVCCLKRPAFKQ